MTQAHSVHVRLTSECSLECMHCYASAWRGRGLFLTDAMLDEILSFALKNGCERLTLTGGEPLQHPQAVSLAERAVAERLPVEIETNGLGLFDCLDRLQPLGGMLRLRVSYDGEARGALAASRALEASHLAARAGIRIDNQVSLYGDSAADPEPVLAAVSDAGLEARVFIGHARFGRGKMLARQKLQEARRLAALVRSYPGLRPVLPPRIDPGASGGDCGWRTGRCEIMPDGTVTACGPSTFERPAWNAGSIVDTALQTIWDSSPFFHRLRALAAADFEEPCASCGHFDRCGGACRAVAWSVRGDLLAAYPWCHDTLTEEVEPDPCH